GRPKIKTAPLGGAASRQAQRGGIFLSPGRPKIKMAPLGGSKPSGAAWGLFFIAGPPQDKNGPLGGSKPSGAAWGLFYVRPKLMMLSGFSDYSGVRMARVCLAAR